MAKQSPADRLNRLQAGACPIHGIGWAQGTEGEKRGNLFMFYCPRRECRIRVFGFESDGRGPWLLPAEFSYLVAPCFAGLNKNTLIRPAKPERRPFGERGKGRRLTMRGLCLNEAGFPVSDHPPFSFTDLNELADANLGIDDWTWVKDGNIWRPTAEILISELESRGMPTQAGSEALRHLNASETANMYRPVENSTDPK